MDKNNISVNHNADHQQPELKEGRDYYIDKGRWVFTEHFLRQRGDCCGSGCRHCPYRHCNVRKK